MASHKYVAKIPTGTYQNGTTKYRYFYSMDEYTAYKNKGNKQYVSVGKRGMFNVDTLGTEDSAEDFRLAGYSEAKNPYVKTKSLLNLTNAAESPRDQLYDVVSYGKEYLAESKILHTPLAAIMKKELKEVRK